MGEVEVYVGPDRERYGECRFGRARSSPRIFGGTMRDAAPPITLAAVQDVEEASRPGGADWGGAHFTVSPSGFLRVECTNGAWVYELFPGKWSDGEGGPFYLCVWRD